MYGGSGFAANIDPYPDPGPVTHVIDSEQAMAEFFHNFEKGSQCVLDITADLSDFNFSMIGKDFGRGSKISAKTYGQVMGQNFTFDKVRDINLQGFEFNFLQFGRWPSREFNGHCTLDHMILPACSVRGLADAKLFMTNCVNIRNEGDPCGQWTINVDWMHLDGIICAGNSQGNDTFSLGVNTDTEAVHMLTNVVAGWLTYPEDGSHGDIFQTKGSRGGVSGYYCRVLALDHKYPDEEAAQGGLFLNDHNGDLYDFYVSDFVVCVTGGYNPFVLKQCRSNVLIRNTTVIGKVSFTDTAEDYTENAIRVENLLYSTLRWGVAKPSKGTPRRRLEEGNRGTEDGASFDYSSVGGRAVFPDLPGAEPLTILSFNPAPEHAGKGADGFVQEVLGGVAALPDDK